MYRLIKKKETNKIKCFFNKSKIRKKLMKIKSEKFYIHIHIHIYTHKEIK